ncbi:methyl-accepting chemotaxis protein [Plebeiibacterium marinum]|uniref:Methyl-accepting chemotaxis protein n=1 Tax=Plebeiibacterium marinum TaxID=2992111 RepID=A0AAE3SJF7_9BACT|nr:methyl-accepting chemotaxis protein [Plebeiobacterium marinum]MCW3805700.1 methyl-accepting chemotaxis protein [Plebeiobacterium marinum]
MNKKLNNPEFRSLIKSVNSSIKVKTNLILASILCLITIVLCSTLYYTLSNEIEKSTRDNMSSHLNDLARILEGQISAKQNKVNIAINFADKLFSECGTIQVKDEVISVSGINQITKKEKQYNIPKWTFGDKEIYKNYSLVDTIQRLTGETATIFQRIEDGYLRISTNVVKLDGTRAVGTFIPNDSEVIKTIEKGNTFYGRAFVVNDWYLTAYKPLYVNNEIQGILYVGVKEKDYGFIKEIFSQKKFYENGYPFIVDENGTFIIHPTKENENYKKAQFFKQLSIKNGEIGRTEYIWPENSQGKKKIQYYKYFDPYKCFVSTSIYKSDMYAGLNKLLLYTTILIFASSILIFIGISRFLSPIIKQLRIMATNAQLVSEGKLTLNIHSKRSDELGKLAVALNNMIIKLRQVVNEIASGAQQLNACGLQVDSTSQDISQGANEQASSIEEVSSTMEEISSNIVQNTANADETHQISKMVAEEIKIVNKKAMDARDISKIISGKIKAINDIAFQTNILSLNAAIEAAKAGEHGRGFGVVADQVRKLAESSKDTANEIIKLVKQSVEMTESAGKSLQDLIPNIEKTNTLVQEITAAGKELEFGVTQINSSLQQINVATVQNAAGSEQLASGAKDLSSQSDSLMQLISFFITDEKYAQSRKEISASDMINFNQKTMVANDPTTKEKPEISINLQQEKDMVDEYDQF